MNYMEVLSDRQKSERNLYKLRTIKDKNEFIKLYEKIECLGNGAFGEVYRIKCNTSGTEFAVKVVNKKFLNRVKNGLRNMKRELVTMEESNHPRIVTYHELLEDN